ncbi:EAL domain-containing protein [Roseomonas gilardii subsp. gilardii]|uniref:bifunctional diguanylate cyclase/phosphodiesterase n=1 Tax=Roseomonas gilardii TaxID=257708 RepID=UPI001FF7FEB6|nr:EAL domain-containing protein [Roseomonas gilardii]UPG72168.1 EAL domain-containing protein [Roseomonas gilardii subsp. gilardii]
MASRLPDAAQPAAGANVRTGLRKRLHSAASRFGADLGLILAILLLFWGGIALHLQREYQRSLDDAARNTGNLAGAAQQIMARTVEAIDQRLLFIREAYRHDPAGFSLDFLRRERGFQQDMSLQAAVIGPSGRLWLSNLGPVQNGVDLSDRAHFRFHLDPQHDDLFISVPVMGRESGRWSVQFTRKLLAADGSFAGVVVISLNPYWLTQVYDTLDIGHGAVTLVGLDGIIRARAPEEGGALGSSIAGSALMSDALIRLQGTFRGRGPTTGTEQMIAFRRVESFPLVVAVSNDMAEILQGYDAYRRSILSSGAVLTLLILVAGGLLIRRRQQRARSQQALSDAIENISQGLVMVAPDGRMPVVNRRAMSLLGVPEEQRASFLRGGRVQDVIPEDCTRNQEEPAGTPAPFYRCTRADGTVLEVRSQALGNGGLVRTFTDVTEQTLSERRVRFMAHHDPLTGLANRTLLHERLAAAIGEAGGREGHLVVLALDLDRFKVVNDTYGHAAGDDLLRQVAARLGELVGPDDTVSRLGGDEFVILWRGAASRAGVEPLARRIVRSLVTPFILDGNMAQVGTSVGIALHPQDGATPESLMRNADTALYRAKAEGRGTVRFFEPAMEAELRERREMEKDLRLALQVDALELHYQPIMTCGNGAIRGFEALLRWTHPVRGSVPPATFIPVAEESGLILPLGRWVMERACAEAATWPEPLRLAVNLSPAQFRSGNLPDIVDRALELSGLPAGRLELEITEGLLIGDAEEALNAIQALKRRGVRIALDDFGTGYASLGYLHRFPFDRIKVDRSFVHAIGRRNGAHAIVEAVLSMSSNLGMEVTAEGVETEEQLRFLQHRACDEVQGFLLGRPMSREAVAQLLRAHGLRGEHLTLP